MPVISQNTSAMPPSTWGGCLEKKEDLIERLAVVGGHVYEWPGAIEPGVVRHRSPAV